MAFPGPVHIPRYPKEITIDNITYTLVKKENINLTPFYMDNYEIGLLIFILLIGIAILYLIYKK